MGQIWPPACFKIRFYTFIVYYLWLLSCCSGRMFVTETIWSTEAKIITIWLFIENISQSLFWPISVVYLSLLSSFIKFQNHFVDSFGFSIITSIVNKDCFAFLITESFCSFSCLITLVRTGLPGQCWIKFGEQTSLPCSWP